MAETTLGQVAHDSFFAWSWLEGVDPLPDPWEYVADAVVAAHEARQWRPIESAPKDGTPVDLWDGFDRIVNGEWDKKANGWIGEVLSYGEMYWRKLDPQPTHWTPIPAPPKEADHGA